MIKPIGILT